MSSYTLRSESLQINQRDDNDEQASIQIFLYNVAVF